jgi:beta-ribofuranosylaminobenzene 5'-phosphate synthase
VIRVTGRPRIHISLADTGLVSPRCYGGVGFTIAAPATIIDLYDDADPGIYGEHALDNGALDAVKDLVNRSPGVPAVRVEIRSHAPQHVGFGSKTTLLLALAAGLTRLIREGRLVKLADVA